MEQPGVVAGNFCLSFSLNFLSIFEHISCSIRAITLIWASLEKSFLSCRTNFGQMWRRQKWKKGQGSSRPVAGGTGVNGLKKLEIHIWSSGSWGPLYFIETALINTAFLHDLGCLTRWTRTRCNRSHNCSGLGMLVCKHIVLYEFVIQNLSERLSQDQ